MSSEQEDRRSDKEKATACFLADSGFVRLVAYHYAPSRDVVNDIVNDVFIYFVERAERWDYRRDMKPLLRKVTQNIAHRHWEKYLRNLPESLGELFDFLRKTNESENERFDLEEEMLALDLCLHKLSPLSRSLIESHYMAKSKLVTIAEMNNIKIGTLKKTMCRIRAVLRQCIERTLGKGVRHDE